jgi:hypothetical protein
MTKLLTRTSEVRQILKANDETMGHLTLRFDALPLVAPHFFAAQFQLGRYGGQCQQLGGYERMIGRPSWRQRSIITGTD